MGAARVNAERKTIPRGIDCRPPPGEHSYLVDNWRYYDIFEHAMKVVLSSKYLGSGSNQQTSEMYSPANDTFFAGPNLPSSFDQHCVAQINPEEYVFVNKLEEVWHFSFRTGKK